MPKFKGNPLFCQTLLRQGHPVRARDAGAAPGDDECLPATAGPVGNPPRPAPVAQQAVAADQLLRRLNGRTLAAEGSRPMFARLDPIPWGS